MYVLPPVFQLSFVGVADPGVPNFERIVLRPTEEVNLAQFGVLLGLPEADGSATPLRDQFFWFGDLVVRPPAWILLYTGAGEFTTSYVAPDNVPAYSFHWGKPTVVFGAGSPLVPMVFGMGGVHVGHTLSSTEVRRLKGPR